MEVKVRKKICENVVTIKKISVLVFFENFSICDDKFFLYLLFLRKSI